MANLQVLQTKYQPAIDLGKARGVSWKNIHIENEKLLIRGAAPNEGIKNDVWNAIKTIDAGYGDLSPGSTRWSRVTRCPRSPSTSTATRRSTRRSSRPIGTS
jgi:hypothetical protein